MRIAILVPRIQVPGDVGSPWRRVAKSLNNRGVLLDINGRKPLWLLNNRDLRRILAGMKQILAIALSALLLAAAAPALASEKCYADYKAKQDNPLRLHYGVMRLDGPCDRGAARSEVAARLSSEGWVLLNVLSVFGKDGLKERKDSAGRYYLRY